MSLAQRVKHLVRASVKTINGLDERQRFAQHLATLFSMAWFVEARDPYTGGHLWRVSKYAQLLAEAGGLPQSDAALIGLGGFLHDLGKIGVPDAILRKQGTLDENEYALIKTHPSVGMRLVAGHPLAPLVRDAILLHHERPDGQGYPLGLTSERIPLTAKIIGLCDAFDAITSHRPYRAGMPIDAALVIIHNGRDRQFDAQWTDVLLELAHTGALTHILGHSDDGIPLLTCPMCGPTLALRRSHRTGDFIFCPNCTGEFILVDDRSGKRAEPTGRMGSPAQLEAHPDSELIAATIAAAVDRIPIAELLASE